jgi:hypothetical protein
MILPLFTMPPSNEIELMARVVVVLVRVHGFLAVPSIVGPETAPVSPVSLRVHECVGSFGEAPVA